MTDSSVTHGPTPTAGTEMSLLGLGSVLLRWRRTIVAWGIVGAVVGVVTGLLTLRVYVAGATFLPQGAEANASGLAAAASQLGIRVPAAGGGWGPPIYVELLRSRALLEPIANDTVVVREDDGRRVVLMDLLGIDAPSPALRIDKAVRELRRVVTASEDIKLGAVKLAVTTQWPSVSLSIADKLVSGVNQFNVQTRKSQAASERQFVEAQAGDAESALRAAEDRMQFFMQRNRVISNDLAFERDRLQRDLILRQQVYTQLVQNREDAKIREVRDIPVITVLENPRLPAVAKSRSLALRLLTGGAGGAILGVLFALAANGIAGARHAPSEEARDFFRLLEEAKPRFSRRSAR